MPELRYFIYLFKKAYRAAYARLKGFCRSFVSLPTDPQPVKISVKFLGVGKRQYPVIVKVYKSHE